MRFALCMVLTAAVFLSAIGVVLARHQSRRQFVELQVLHQQRDVMNDEWRQLLLEEATFGSPEHVERDARQRLGMKAPVPEAVTVVIR